MRGDCKPWSPLNIFEVQTLFSNAAFPWWIAGGHAIEIFVGHAFRDHGDIDVLMLRRDSAAVRDLLAGWDLWMADPPGQLRPWRPEEALPGHVSDVWCRRHPGDDWRLQLMLDDATGEYWHSRRAGEVRLPIADIGSRTADGLPVLRAEVQLFYKAKSPRAKDRQDFEACLPRLDLDQRAWLKGAITTAYGGQNPWAALL
jgi:hypothetical protein